MKLTLLILAFAVTAALYASVGFGGGSTYTALLVLTGTEFYLIPLISLMCNITVVSSNAVRYSREKLVPWRRLLPLITFSIPAAWLGGRLVVSETLFIGLLWVSLLIAGVRLLRRHAEPQKSPKSLPVWGLACMGAAIGLLSGIVGIGGGIFLAPVLHAVNWGKARVIAASCSVFSRVMPPSSAR